MFKTHGDSAWPRTAEYAAWNNMIQRCTNRKSSRFKDYGGRGISVCDRWKAYENFLADMGRRPGNGYSIDRHPNNDGNYEPGNCRWATRKQQARNTRASLQIEINGETRTLAEWAERTGIPVSTLQIRISLKWTAADLISKPVAHKGKLILAFGRQLTIKQWSQETGIKYITLHARLFRYKLSPEAALSNPVRP